MNDNYILAADKEEPVGEYKFGDNGMNRDDIIRMAREAGFLVPAKAWVMKFERFATLVAAAEREACAKVCEERERANLYGVKECAAAIRARGEK